MFSFAEVQTKAINCISANKSCLLRVVHTKAIAALTQFCDFFNLKFLKLQIFSISKILLKPISIHPKITSEIIQIWKKSQNCVKAAIAFVCTTCKRQVLFALQ